MPIKFNSNIYIHEISPKIMKNVIAAFTILCLLCSLSSATSVKIESQRTVSPNEVFNITIETDKGAVIGVMLDISEFTLVDCSEPYEVSGDAIALAIINTTKAECTLKAPSKKGEFTLEGRWMDMLNKEEGELKTSIAVGVPTTPTATPTAQTTTPPPITTVTTPKTPGFEFVTTLLTIIVIWRWFR